MPIYAERKSIRPGAEVPSSTILPLSCSGLSLPLGGAADRQVGEAAALAPVGDQRGDVVIDRDAQFAAGGRQFKPFDAL